MRVLHVWDECGIAGMLSRTFRERGIVCNVVKRFGFDNGLHQDSYYNTRLIVNLAYPPVKSEDVCLKRKLYLILPSFLRGLAWKLFSFNRTLCFYVMAMKQAKNYELVHIHSLFWMCLFVPFKPKVLLFHGDDIRESPSLKGRFKRRLNRSVVRLLSLWHTIYVSTPDLVGELPNTKYVPNPVDDRLFHPRKSNVNPKGHALFFLNWFGNLDWAEKIAVNHGWKLTVLNRSRQEHVQYAGMPKLLSYFEVFIDRKNIRSLSKTALEALAMGLRVVRWDGEIVEGLSDEHRLDNVADCWMQIYKEKLKS